MEEVLSRRERKKLQSRQAILDAAAREFARKGFRETSVADIMNAADLGIGTFYNYFDSKEEILMILLGNLVAEVKAALMELRSAKSLAREQLAAGSRITARFLDENRFVLPLFLSGSISAHGGEKRDGTHAAPGFKEIFETIIREGQADGEFRKDLPADLIAEMLHSIYQAAAFSKLDISFQENIRQKATILLDGIMARSV